MEGYPENGQGHEEDTEDRAVQPIEETQDERHVHFDFTSDPKHPGPNSTENDLEAYKRDLGKYSKEMLDAFIET